MLSFEYLILVIAEAFSKNLHSSTTHDWLFKVPQPIRSHMHDDVARYMKYYNVDRPIQLTWISRQLNLKGSFRKVSGWSRPEHFATQPKTCHLDPFQ